MSENGWMGLILLSLVIGLLVGAWICEKAEDYRTRVLSKKLEEQTGLAEYYNGLASVRDAERINAERELRNAKKERDKYREFWADELQKRLELADYIGRHEELKQYVEKTVREAAGRGETSADYPCD